MTAVATLYNMLPDLGKAEAKVAKHQFDQVALAELLAKYMYDLGIQLVHTHCQLAA